MDRTELLLIAAVILLLLVLLLLLWLRSSITRQTAERIQTELKLLLDDSGDEITDRIGDRIGEIREALEKRLSQDTEENRRNRIEIREAVDRGNESLRGAFDRFSEVQRSALSQLSETQNRKLSELSETQNQKLSELSESQNRILSGQQEKQFDRLRQHHAEVQTVLKESLKELSDINREKLSEIQGEINKKLDTSLNERLDESFKNVGEQLNQLYKSLGELGKLESGVSSLNRTLSNVKTRGILGETQLENILASILANTLYDRNVVTKAGSRDPVEFAVRIPDKEVQGSFMYLPIDSKFPTTIYDKLCEASEKGDAEGVLRAQKELEQRIKAEAKSICEKYVDPPQTTDFAIMFLPTESLYAEVLRIPGLTEECQRKHHIVITGPTTIAALLNSLSIGFRYMAVNRDSQNVLRLLSAIKTQYGKLQDLILTAESRLDSAKKATSELSKRTSLINKKLSAVEEIDVLEAKQLLGISESAEVPDGEPGAL